MPPKIRYSRESIIEAAFEVVRADGEEHLNARTVARRLGCSTQPVLYHFADMKELKKEVCVRADDFHTEYITRISGTVKDMMLNIGIRYIRFAVEEKHLFRMLFQSDYMEGNMLTDLIGSEEQSPVVQLLMESLHLSAAESKQVFLLVLMFAHGFASTYADNDLPFDETFVQQQLKLSVQGALLAVKNQNLPR